VLYSYKTDPPCEGRATPCGMARSQAQDNLPQLAPMLYDTLVHRARMP